MFESIDKAKQIGAFSLERIGDYLDLIGLDIEVQLQDIRERAANGVRVFIFGLLALLFFGLALIVTSWNSEYRILAAWLVFALYLVPAGIFYVSGRRHHSVEPALKVVREELKQDLQLLRRVLGSDRIE